MSARNRTIESSYIKQEAQHKNLPVGMTPPSDAIKGMSARQEITMPPNRQFRSRGEVPEIHRSKGNESGTINAAMMDHSIHRTGT